MITQSMFIVPANSSSFFTLVTFNIDNFADNTPDPCSYDVGIFIYGGRSDSAKQCTGIACYPDNHIRRTGGLVVG